MYATFPEIQKNTWANFVFKLSQILKTVKWTYSRKIVDAFTSLHRRSFDKILFHIFLLASSQENIKKFCSRAPLQFRLRHLIVQFANNNKNV